MGRRGPPKKPTELKLLQGAPGGVSKLPRNEPKPPKVQDAKPPRELSSDGKKVWRSMAPKLEALGLLTVLDLPTFRRYCELSARYAWCVRRLERSEWNTHIDIFHEQSEEEIKAKVAPRLKYQQERVESIEFRRIPRELLRLEKEFGMTPASRASISPTEGPRKKDPSDVKEFLYGRFNKPKP